MSSHLGKAPVKPFAQYKLVGTGIPRNDIPDKVAGKYVYMQHVRVPGMLHGRVESASRGQQLRRGREGSRHRRNLHPRDPRCARSSQGRFCRCGSRKRMGCRAGCAAIESGFRECHWPQAGHFRPARSDAHRRKTTDKVVLERGDMGAFWRSCARGVSTTSAHLIRRMRRSGRIARWAT